MKILGVIPARGGSKSVPLKNIRPLAGKPLLAYTILSAQAAKHIDRLVVSTDHDGIAAVAKSLGVEVVRRPAELATDEASTESALLHVCDELKKKDGFSPDVVLTLEPTSPFRTTKLIESCIALFNETDADSVIGVTETRSNYGKIVKGKFEFLFPGQPRRRQDRAPLYMESSTLYGTRVDVLRKKKSVLGDKLAALIVPPEEAVDINTVLDFELAEKLMTSGKK